MWTKFRLLPRPLRILFVASFVNRAGMFVFPLLAVYLVQGQGMTTGRAGALISIGSTGLLVGSFLSGALCDRAGRRATLVLSLVLNSVGYLALATLHGPAWTYAAWLFVALVGMGMFSPAANTLIADLADPEQRPFAFTVSYISNNLGMGVGPLLGGVAAAYSYGLMFAGNIVLSMLCALLILLAVPGNTARQPVDTGTQTGMFAGIRANVLVLVVVITSFCYVAPLIGLEYALPLAFTQTLGASAALIGVVYTINSIIVVAMGLLIERRLQRYGTSAMLVASGLIWAAGMAVLAFAFSVPAILISTVIWTIGEIIASVVVPSYIADRVESRYVSSFMALNSVVLGAARLVVPFGLGVLWQTGGHRPVFYLLLAVPLVGAACYAVIGVRTARKEPLDATPAADPVGSS